MARKPKQTPLQTCADCVHEYACCAWTLGGRLATQNAEKCPYFETVRSSAAYLIGKMEANEWISVKDRLPEKETIVLCWRGRRWCEPEICTYGDLKGEECFYYIDDCGFPMKCLRPSITHWMPLPEPPKEEEV